jgi:hypothetical protein
MYGYFTNECLSISLERNKDGNLSLNISSDFGNQRFHKSQLNVCEKRLATEVEQTWKAIKTKKLQTLHVGFGEIDWYDSMTDMYDTPTAYIKRGKKRAEVGWVDHGSIPKDWSVNLHANILNTITINPVLEVVKNAIGMPMYKPIEKLLIKSFRPVLQKKKEYASYYSENTED